MSRAFVLKCDYRENRGACLISRLREAHAAAPSFDFIEEVLTVGDYVIVSGPYFLVIERKTWADLAASFRDDRIFENHKKMLDAARAGCHIMYLIEGTLSAGTVAVGGIPVANMRAKLDHFAVRDRALIEHTRDAAHTATRLIELGRNLNTCSAPAHHVASTSGEPRAARATTSVSPSESSPAAPPTAEGGDAKHPSEAGGVADAKEGVEGGVVHPSDAGLAAAHPPSDIDAIVKKRYEKSVAEVRFDMIKCVGGIGDKYGRALVQDPAMWPGILTARAIPDWLPAMPAAELRELAAGRRPAVYTTMLAQIKGVSSASAAHIATNIPLSCLLEPTTNIAAEIGQLKPAGRCLGVKLGQRIAAHFTNAA